VGDGHAVASVAELVLHFTKTLANEIDDFVRQARRKPQRYPVVSRGFATTHGG
jgi:hypothetical protein